MMNQDHEHWKWRMEKARELAASFDGERYGVSGIYIFGSTKNACAGPGSDIDLIIHLADNRAPSKALLRVLDAWQDEIDTLNYKRTGLRTTGLLDVHFVTDQDRAQQECFASKIDAVTDGARPLPMKTTAT